MSEDLPQAVAPDPEFLRLMSMATPLDAVTTTTEGEAKTPLTPPAEGESPPAEGAEPPEDGPIDPFSSPENMQAIAASALICFNMAQTISFAALDMPKELRFVLQAMAFIGEQIDAAARDEAEDEGEGANNGEH